MILLEIYPETVSVLVLAVCGIIGLIIDLLRGKYNEK